MMNFNCLITALLVLVSITISAQTYNGDLTLTTQAQVDNFNYSIVTGSLMIENSNTDPIKNLNGLSSLTEVRRERLRISADSLVSLDGLQNLTSIRGALDIYGANIENINALNGLTQVLGFHILIAGCENLIHIDVLNSLTTLGNNTSIQIFSCKKLLDINGFNGISIVNTMYIEDCPNLESIQGFSSLQNNKNLFIDNNPELTDLSGFKNFETGSEYLSITNNAKFDRFCDLHKLFSNNGIGGIINISGNAQNPTPEEIIAAGACESTSTSEITEQSVSVYPNPAQSMITISCPNFMEATIYSTTGDVVLTSNNPVIDLQNLQSGLYMVEVKTGQGNFQTKFLKQ